MNLSAILADRDFGLRMRFEKRDIAEFFQASADHEAVMAERRSWIARHPEQTVAITPEGVGLLDETVELADRLNTLPASAAQMDWGKLDPFSRCQALGESWEPDFLLMAPGPDGVFRLVGGSLCFPSHWDLRTKLTRSMAEIHQPVPNLNETLGKQINGFLQRIRPGISWERENWGLSATAELNLHPSRSLPRLDANAALNRTWFRLERQSLVALPGTGGVLFGIRVVTIPMQTLCLHPEWKHGMMRALESMPEEMARYKGISSARRALVEQLASVA